MLFDIDFPEECKLRNNEKRDRVKALSRFSLNECALISRTTRSTMDIFQKFWFMTTSSGSQSLRIFFIKEFSKMHYWQLRKRTAYGAHKSENRMNKGRNDLGSEGDRCHGIRIPSERNRPRCAYICFEVIGIPIMARFQERV